MINTITNWLLPDLLGDPQALFVVLVLVALIESYIRPFLPFATDIAEIKHNKTCHRIDESIKAIKTSFGKVEAQADELDTFLGGMSSQTSSDSFNTDRLNFDTKYRNVRMEIEACAKKITNVSEAVETGKLSTENDIKESDDNLLCSVILLAVVMAVLGMLKSSDFFGGWIFDKGSWIAVGIYLNRTIMQRRKASKCYLLFKQKYADYEPMLPDLDNKRESLLEKVRSIDYFYTHVKNEILDRKRLQDGQHQALLQIEARKVEIEAQKVENEKNKSSCIIM